MVADRFAVFSDIDLLRVPEPSQRKQAESQTMLAVSPWFTIARATSPFANGRLQMFSQIALGSLGSGAGLQGPGSP